MSKKIIFCLLALFCAFGAAAEGRFGNVQSGIATQQSAFIFHRPTDASPFRLSWICDGILLGGGLGLELGGRLALHFRDDGDFDSSEISSRDVNRFDWTGMRKWDENWDLAGEVLHWISVAAPAALFAAGTGEYATIFAMYAESILIADGVNSFCKAFVTRWRPYAYFDDPKEIGTADSARSFFSGHTTRAFNGAVFASYVFAKHFPSSPWTPAVVALSLSAATSTAIARGVSGCHFASDIITGAIFGSLTGFLVPFFHSIGQNQKIKPQIAPTSLSIRADF